MTTNAPGTLDDAYFEWLYSHVNSVTNRNPSRSYWNLCKQLYSTEFFWFVPNDDNRIEDGKELRSKFLNTGDYSSLDPQGLWSSLGCSVFEMLIALAQRAAYDTDGQLSAWFWRFMHNLELDSYSDLIYEISIKEEVEVVLDRLIYRTYLPDGNGGLFPLHNAQQDQREVELWYQMSAYLQEGIYVNDKPRW